MSRGTDGVTFEFGGGRSIVRELTKRLAFAQPDSTLPGWRWVSGPTLRGWRCVLVSQIPRCEDGAVSQIPRCEDGAVCQIPHWEDGVMSQVPCCEDSAACLTRKLKTWGTRHQ